MQDEPDMPLDNFGAETEVATPPVASSAAQIVEQQTTQPTEASGSETEQGNGQPVTEEDNPIAEEQKSGRPEKQERLQNRFGELTGKIKQRDTYIEELEAKIARAQAMGEVPQLKPNAEGEYDVQAIIENQGKVAQASAQAEVQVLRQQMERETVAARYDAEAKDIISSHKALNPGTKSNPNPEYDLAIAEAVEEAINATVQNNVHNLEALKQISPKKIADSIMKGYESAGRRAQTQSAQNLQTIQSEQAVTPQGPASNNEDLDGALETRVADIKF